MTLNRVGSSHGVAIDLLTQFKRDYPQTNFIAAGGVRNIEDIKLLKMVRIDRILLASALHSGAITKADILKF
jgi:phosphoribosylformimino-5-aminoimidazole carboxamide ribotide isomerase